MKSIILWLEKLGQHGTGVSATKYLDEKRNNLVKYCLELDNKTHVSKLLLRLMKNSLLSLSLKVGRYSLNYLNTFFWPAVKTVERKSYETLGFLRKSFFALL